MNRDRKYTYVTLLGTDDYVIGTLCLVASLKRVASKYPLLVLCSRGVSDSTVDLLKQRGIECRTLNQSVTVENVNTGKFERWNYTFDKLQAFNLTEYEKVLFLDSDMFVVKNMDHLFEKPHMSAVYADVWDETACEGLNSGLMVIEPSKSVCEGLVGMLYSERFINSSSYGDQDIIRAYYDGWMRKTECRLPVGYNLYYPFVKDYLKSPEGTKDDIYNIHFVYDKKPWQYSFAAFLRRLKKYQKGYLIRYMILVYRYRIFLRMKGIRG